MKLSDLRVCVECDEVYGPEWDRCPDCGETESWPISKWVPMVRPIQEHQPGTTDERRHNGR